MTADVNVTAKVAQALYPFAFDPHSWPPATFGQSVEEARAERLQDAMDAARRALAVLSDPEVLAGIAGVLREHTWISLYSSRERTAECACGVTLPYTPESDDEFDEAIERAFRDHQAAALADWLRGQG